MPTGGAAQALPTRKGVEFAGLEEGGKGGLDGAKRSSGEYGRKLATMQTMARQMDGVEEKGKGEAGGKVGGGLQGVGGYGEGLQG